MKKNNLKFIFIISFLAIAGIKLSSYVWADAVLDKVAQDNVPSWFYEETRRDWEENNQYMQQRNEELGENFFTLITEDEIVRWTYTEADLDGTNSKDYLIIVYGDDAYACSIVVLKKENASYMKIWELSQNERLSGLISSTRINLDDLDGDNKPEIIIDTQIGASRPCTGYDIIKWKGSESYRMPPYLSEASFIDLNRDGIKEILRYSYETEDIELPENIAVRKYTSWYELYKFDGTEYVLTDEKYNDGIWYNAWQLKGEQYEEIDWKPREGSSFMLLADLTEVIPEQWNLEWADSTETILGDIRMALSNIDENHNVDEIDLLSVRLEERVKPLRVVIENEKLWIEFNKQEVMDYLLKFPRLEPLQPGNKIDITISAILNSGQYVSGSSGIEIAASVESTIEIQPDKWNIHWLKKDKDDEKEHPGKGKIKCYIGNIGEHTVDDILSETILLNNTVSISEHGKKEKPDAKVKKHRKEFEGEVLEAEFNKFKAIKSLGEVKQGDIVTVTVTGKLSDGKTFKGEDTIQIIGKEPEE